METAKRCAREIDSCVYLREAVEKVEENIVLQAAVEVVRFLASPHGAGTGDCVPFAVGTFQLVRSPNLVPNVLVQEAVAALVVVAVLRESAGKQDTEMMNVARLGSNQLAVEDLIVIR